MPGSSSAGAPVRSCSPSNRRVATRFGCANAVLAANPNGGDEHPMRKYAILVFLSSLLLAVPTVLAQAPPIESLVPPGLKDLTSTVVVAKANIDALTKVSPDFANSYRLKTMHLTYKEPGMMRMEGKAGPLSIVYILNGDRKGWKVGMIKGSKDVKKSPAQKQGLMDFGLLTKAQLADFNSTYLRTEKVRGITTYVYELQFKEPTENLKRILWVDPAKHVIVRRENLDRAGKLKMVYEFESPKRIGDDVWVPTVIKVYNAAGELGAVSNLVATRLNSGIPSDMFKV